MSISIGHRAILTAFRRGGKPVEANISPSMPPFPGKETKGPAVLGAGEFLCSPWEGLYLEQATASPAVEFETAALPQLDAFLTSLMYGE